MTALNYQRLAKKSLTFLRLTGVKVEEFKMLSDVYRNFQKKYHTRVSIIAGVLNLRHGF